MDLSVDINIPISRGRDDGNVILLVIDVRYALDIGIDVVREGLIPNLQFVA